MPFISDDYKEESSSQYFKMQEGDNRIRILGSQADGTLLIGYELWVTADKTRKPVRRPKNDFPASMLEVNPKTGETEYPRLFWIFPVWNYATNQVEVMEVTQKTIREGILNLARNPKWGDPDQYDIVITQTKDAGKTSYLITPDPKETLAADITAAFAATKLNLSAMWSSDEQPYGGSPFGEAPAAAKPAAKKAPASAQTFSDGSPVPTPPDGDEIDIDSIDFGGEQSS